MDLKGREEGGGYSNPERGCGRKGSASRHWFSLRVLGCWAASGEGGGQTEGWRIGWRGSLNESSHQHMEARGKFLQETTFPKSKGAMSEDVPLCEMIYRSELILAWSRDMGIART